jgi:DNA repair protein RecO (recombination protein O)
VTRLAERIYRTEAIILRRSELGEADRILTLYTPQWGKRRAIAKGIRRPASKLRGHLELFTRAKLLLARGRTLDVITGAETAEAFHGLRDEHPGALERIGIAYYLVELLDQFTEEEQENRALWDLISDSLRALSDGVEPRVVARHYELRLLGYLGYQPNLDECMGCGEPLRPGENWYSADQGGVLCPECRHIDPTAEPISVNALKLLRLFAREDARTVAKIRFSAALASEIEDILRRAIRQIADREITSLAVLRTMQGER